MAEKKPFRYTPRTKEQVKARASQQGGAYDQYTNTRIPVFSAGKKGDYELRFLPPTWDGAEHYGIDVFVHYNVGADNGTYLCLQKMKGEACPVCEAKKQAERAKDDELAAALATSKRVLAYVIDRSDEQAGPKIWSMGWSLDRDFSALAIDKKTSEVLCIDDPDDGYDVSFSNTVGGQKSKYGALEIARKSTQLSSDLDEAEGWLDFIMKNPLPDQLNYFDADYLQNLLEGRASKEGDDDDDVEKEEKPARRKLSVPADDDEGDEKPKKSEKAPFKKDEDVAPSRGKLSAPAEDEEEKPIRRKLSAPAEDEEEKPVRRKLSAPATDDDDEDDERPKKKSDDDDDEAEPPRRSLRERLSEKVGPKK